MHNPHAGNDPEEEEDEDNYEESDGEGEDSRSPVAFVAGHFRVLPSGVKVRDFFCLEYISRQERRRSNEVLIIRPKLGCGAVDLALLWGNRCLESASPSLPYDASDSP